MSNLILVGWDVSSLNKKSIINLVKSILEEDYPEDEVEEALDEFITDLLMKMKIMVMNMMKTT